MKYILTLASILTLIVTGCAPTTGTPPASSIPASPQPALTFTEAAPAFSAPTAASVVASPAPASQPTLITTPTPDLRLPPEKWREWPVLPELSAHAREIYQRGIASGNDPQAFSKIGDCQSVPASFMGVYDQPGKYSFPPELQPLQETIDHFSGDFSREGEAVRGGFNTATVISPLWANAKVCQPGENPIECENRVHNPSLTFVSLEVWFSGRTPEVYEKYLRRIIEYNLEQGVLPILATKADNVEGDYSINYTIAKLAYEYDLPLWNFWRAVQSASNHGLDPNDATGFHLNVEGWNIRSFTALQVLDKLRRELEGLPSISTDAQVTPTAQVVTEFIPGPIANPSFATVESHSGATTDNLLIDLAARNGENLTSTGIFQTSLNGQNWNALLEPGLTLLDQSTSGTLARQTHTLWLIRDSQRQMVTDQLANNTQPAQWTSDGRIAVITQNNGLVQVSLYNPADGATITYPAAEAQPLQLVISNDPAHLFWSAGTCANNTCKVTQLITANLDGTLANTAAASGESAVHSANRIALPGTDTDRNQLTILIDGQPSTLKLPGNRILHMAWSPDGTTLAVITAEVSAYSGRTLNSALQLIALPNKVTQAFQVEAEVLEQMIWSPTGNQLLLVKRAQADGGLQLNFLVYDLAAKRMDDSLGFDLLGETYLIPQRILWLP